MSAVEAVWFGSGILVGVIVTTVVVLGACFLASVEGAVDAEKGQ